jgi:hypothetical protein
MRFEGEDVDGCTITVRGFKGPIGDPLVRGQKIEIICTVEVVEVAYRENLNTGQLFRDHVVKIAEVQ